MVEDEFQYIEAVMDDGVEYMIRDGEWASTDRKRGILTKGDREYLLDQSSVEGQDQRNTRYRIRQRLTESLLDLVLLTEVTGMEEDVERVLENDRVDNEYVRRAVVLFAYDLLRYDGDVENAIDEFEEAIQESLIERTEPKEDRGEVAAIRSNAELEVSRTKLGEVTIDDEKAQITVEEIPDSSDDFEEFVETLTKSFEDEYDVKLEKVESENDS